MDSSARVALPDEAEQRLRLLVGWVALAWCALYGWFCVVQGRDVPVLWFIQLAVHEAGHRVFIPFGNYTMLLMGSGSEILAPLLIGVGCLAWRTRRNLIAAGMCWAVAAGACIHTAAYMADAPRGEMTLIGGDESDWLVIFDRYWDKLYKADVYAARMRTVGLVVWLGAVALVVAGMVLAYRRVSSAEHAGEPVATAIPTGPVQRQSDADMWR